MITQHIPAVLRAPAQAGEKKKADLAHLSAYGFTFRGVAYRLVYGGG